MSDTAPSLPDDAPLAVICGGGSLPFAVADAVTKRGRRVVLFRDSRLGGSATCGRLSASLGQARRLGWFCRVARHEGCRDVVFIGSVVRPAIWQIRLDLKTLRLLPRVLGMFRGGDDHLLTGVAAMFEENGFRLIAAHEIAPEILMPEGTLGRARPSMRDQADIAKGLALLRCDQSVRHRSGRGRRRRARAGGRSSRRDGSNARPHRAVAPKWKNSRSIAPWRAGENGQARPGPANRSAVDRTANGRRRRTGRARRHCRRRRKHDRRRARPHRCGSGP